MELAPRKQKILSAVVENFILTGEPVGSKTLISETGLEVSSATVRNDMADLTQRGYLVQPHTSAGRIPTQQGYRYYVDNIMSVTPVSEQGREYIAETLYRCADSPENILKKAAELVSELTDLAAVATTPNASESRIHRISFVQTGSHTAMAVVIASNGIIKNQLFRCEFLITPEILTVFDKAVNEIFGGVRLSAINQPFIQTAASRFGELSLLMAGVLTAIKDASDRAQDISVFLSGQTKLFYMSYESFMSAKNVVDFLGNTHDLARMLENLPITTSVSIGTENSRVELAASSVISTRYDIENTPSGVIAVIAPIRTNYSRAVAITECVADCVSEIIGELIEI